MAKTRRDKAARIVDAAFEIIVEQGWRAITLDAVAVRCGIERAEVYRLTPSPAAILDLFARRIDLALLDETAPAPPEESDTGAVDGTGGGMARDRLFDILMRRFEALAPYRAALGILARDLPRDPATVAATLPQARRSFALMLREAGIDDRGLRGAVRVAAL
ncbi:MAG: TetR family transcriptional regulator, partial [Alphaproteobacteria bacterium]